MPADATARDAAAAWRCAGRAAARWPHGAAARVAGGHQALDGVVVIELDARARVQAGGGEPFGGQARQPRAGVVQDQRTFGQPAGVNRAGACRTRAGRPAPDRAARAAAPAVRGRLGQRHRPTSSVPSASRSKVSCEVSTATRTSMRGGRAPASPAPAAAGGRWPRWTRPASRGPPAPGPALHVVQRRLASASRRRARASRVSPMAVGAPARACA